MSIHGAVEQLSTPPIVGFAGLTHLGLNSAVASAARGFRTIGYHDDTKVIEQLNRGVLHVLEPGLPELLKEHQERLAFSADVKALGECNIVYLAVDVPTDANGVSDLTPIQQIIRTATAVMRPDALLVILCQVPPGFTRQVDWPASQRFYQVETLVFGRAVERALKPERIILGIVDTDQVIDKRLHVFLEAFHCPVLPMRYESAELAKISINLCLVAMVSTANTLAELCERIGADWAEIVPALKLDLRIGEHSYLNPGLGISGGNLERDLATVQRFSRIHQTDGGVVDAWIQNSLHRKDWPWQTMQQLGLDQNPQAKIAILGLTYKENTHSVKNSPALLLLSHLNGWQVSVYDPEAVMEATSALNRVESILEALTGADVVAVMTPWPEFRSLSAEMLAENMNGRVILDPYRMLDGSSLTEAKFKYFTLGATMGKTQC